MRKINLFLTISQFCVTGFLFLFPVPEIQASSYSGISGDNTYEWITNVTLGNINKSSAQDANGYGNNTFDRTGIWTRITPGKTYTLKVTIHPDTTWCNEYLYAYIDWNHDRDFTDTGEKIRVTAATKTCVQGPHTVNINVPANAAGGETLMRIVVRYYNVPPSAGSIPEGEAEDYTLVVDYPTVTGKNTAEWITNVTLGNLNKTTGQEPDGYGNYSFWNTSPALITTLTDEKVNQLRVTITPDPNGCDASQGDGENVSAFFDWNHDGDFRDTNEELKLAVNTCNPGPHVKTVRIPDNAHPGRTRMRIVLHWGYPPPTTGNIFGEAEDYTLFVINKFPWPMFLPAIINAK